ncbi:MAG: hypothetical protein LBL66_04260 [Clostridiales bacterium]|jgi:hypothetical protein|nr:hypothetical protein [Clostridiales bacterium]
MRKGTIRAVILCALLAAFLPACGKAGEGATVEGERFYTLELAAPSVDLYTWQRVVLPAPTAAAPDGSDVTDRVRVAVKYEDGSVYVPERLYAPGSEFRAGRAGRYTAEYALYHENGGVAARKTAVITASDEGDPESGIEADGLIGEAAYSEGFRTGLNGNMTVKYRFSQKGVYLGVDVKDGNLIYNRYVAGRFTQSDGFEVYLNLGGGADDVLNGRCYRIQVNVAGDVWVGQAKSGRVGFELNERLQPPRGINYHGTRTEVGGGIYDHTYLDTDEGYTCELYLPYLMLDIDPATLPDTVGIAFSHRDVASSRAEEIQMGAPFNAYYSDVQLPAGVDQVIHTNGSNYVLTSYDAYSVTALYRKLYVKGTERTGICEPQTAPMLKIDGAADEAAWAGAADVAGGLPAGIAAKALLREEGLYVRVDADDATVTTGPYEDIAAGDCVQINIAAGETLGQTELRQGYGIAAKCVEINPAGRVNLKYLNKGGSVFWGGFDYKAKAAERAGGYGVTLFIPAYELGITPDAATTPKLCIGVVDNGGGAPSSAADYAYSCDRANPAAYIAAGRQVGR